MAELNGQCLCGAVQVSMTPVRQAMVACHCDMCRQWTSSMYMAIQAEPGSLTVTGSPKTYVSSDRAERAFCGSCGSAVWFKINAPGPLHGQVQVAAGLFENSGDVPLKLELHIEQKPSGYAFEGKRRQMTGPEEMALHDPAPSGDSE